MSESAEWLAAEVELADYRRALHIVDPERESSIEWQRGVDYGLTADA